ncbi:tRNA1Val (adenine37-N6)-methyltransferase [Pasteurella langaaensis DSM 22999]|uniref:tRNA1(Val) (adenine(37)-N6)-methyltransferase n=1 Tax=Alitibacter langaaensis DSM 22999 TaxID=1122935 RepID=A0A2U0TCP7_9PAST|nr:tRNA1(Val) (adenine(37)-N6)-methyltransferase [Pasteurella langaaensis]PVX41358.1 tRNA1Val (adenine37-N6)-methyltransferase [Pasteurella langaaensis DSM 22999]
MAKSQGFSFKQFHINHDRCAMKVGTDGILLGAWADVSQASSCLDLGTGSGLIALMLAQRTLNTQIVGVEIDPDAAQQACENVKNSPWAERVQIVQQDIALFAKKCGQNGQLFDVIVANPPYFPQGVDCISDARNTARYTALLSHLDWLLHAEQCLAPNGTIHFVLPFAQGENLLNLTALFCIRRCDVVTKLGKAPQRILLSFAREKQECEHTELVIYDEHNQYTAEFRQLTQDFYLNF